MFHLSNTHLFHYFNSTWWTVQLLEYTIFTTNTAHLVCAIWPLPICLHDFNELLAEPGLHQRKPIHIWTRLPTYRIYTVILNYIQQIQGSSSISESPCNISPTKLSLAKYGIGSIKLFYYRCTTISVKNCVVYAWWTFCCFCLYIKQPMDFFYPNWQNEIHQLCDFHYHPIWQMPERPTEKHN